MKNRCKILNIAFCELKTQWRGFAIFFIISCLLISSMVSIFSLAKQMPDEIQEYISLSFFDTITVDDIDINDLEQIESLPLKINSYSLSDLDCEAIGIPTGTSITKDEYTVYFEGSCKKWLPDGKMPALDFMNQLVVKGKQWEKSDNERKVIWISTETADILGKECGDTVTLNLNKSVKSINCTIEGIYKSNPGVFDYYIPISLYFECMGENLEPFGAVVTPTNLKNYRIVINKLNSMYLRVSAQSEFIDSLLFLVYALYVICGFLCVLEVSIMISISKLYFHKRNAFYSIEKAMGLQNKDILKIVFLVMEGLFAISFILSMFIAPFLSKNVINLVNEFFVDVGLSSDVWTKTSLILFFVNSFLLYIACRINKIKYKSASILELIQQQSQ